MADYPQDMYQQLVELKEKSEQLEAEERRLQAEKSRLLAENKRLIKELMDTMTVNTDERKEAAIVKAVEPLKRKIARKDEQLEKAGAEIGRLKARLDKDSGNSSKPPSRNG